LYYSFATGTYNEEHYVDESIVHHSLEKLQYAYALQVSYDLCDNAFLFEGNHDEGDVDGTYYACNIGNCVDGCGCDDDSLPHEACDDLAPIHRSY